MSAIECLLTAAEIDAATAQFTQTGHQIAEGGFAEAVNCRRCGGHGTSAACGAAAQHERRAGDLSVLAHGARKNLGNSQSPTASRNLAAVLDTLPIDALRTSVQPALRAGRRSAPMEFKSIAQFEKASRRGANDSFRLGVGLVFVVVVMLYTGLAQGMQGPHGVMLVVAAMIGGYMAMNIGANDVANNVGPAVGSKAVSMIGALSSPRCSRLLAR